MMISLLLLYHSKHRLYYPLFNQAVSPKAAVVATFLMLGSLLFRNLDPLQEGLDVLIVLVLAHYKLTHIVIFEILSKELSPEILPLNPILILLRLISMDQLGMLLNGAG